MIMSDVGWTLWAAIQARISPIDYDFTGWAEERWARASAAIDGPDFEALAGGGLSGRPPQPRSGPGTASGPRFRCSGTTERHSGGISLNA